jgi:hypothetical protein
MDTLATGAKAPVPSAGPKSPHDSKDSLESAFENRRTYAGPAILGAHRPRPKSRFGRKYNGGHLAIRSESGRSMRTCRTGHFNAVVPSNSAASPLSRISCPTHDRRAFGMVTGPEKVLAHRGDRAPRFRSIFALPYLRSGKRQDRALDRAMAQSS